MVRMMALTSDDDGDDGPAAPVDDVPTASS
jgi:hypothetical protein